MKVVLHSLSRLKRVVFFPGLCALWLASCPQGLASPEDNPSDVLAAAKAWLSLIDAGQYEASYNVASGVFHESITEDKWEMTLKTLRTPMGKVIDREVTSHSYKPDGIPGLDGACVIITYDTSFAHADAETESVILKSENGKWLGVSYTWGPKPSQNSDSDSAPNSSSSTTTTDTHITPPPREPPPSPSPQPLPQ